MEFVHVLSRGVDKRKIFMDDQDRYRFIHDLFEFNNQIKTKNIGYFFNKSNDFASRYIEEKPRKLLVMVHAFCLMENHYHLLLSPLVEDGVVKFMRKLNIGYAKYFNEKYERKGALFEGRYKSVPVITDAHFIHLPYYIHLNPLDFEFPEWRKRQLKDHDKAIKFLESYKWSSHQDYLGKTNLPSITQRDELLKFFNGNGGYQKNIKQYINGMNLDKDVSLE